MSEYKEDWLFHYHELMAKEEKHASKKLNQNANKVPANGILFGKELTPQKKQTVKLIPHRGTIDIADLKNMTFEEFKRDFWHLQNFKEKPGKEKGSKDKLAAKNKEKKQEESQSKVDPALAEEYRIIELTNFVMKEPTKLNL
jgi:hypothetical protein